MKRDKLPIEEMEETTEDQTGLPEKVEETPADEKKHEAADNLQAKAELNATRKTDAFDDFSDEDFEEQTATLLKIDDLPMEQRRTFVFDGFMEKDLPAQDGSGEAIPTKCAVLFDKSNGTKYICPLTTVVSTCETITTIPAPVQLLNLGKPSGKKYYDVRVFIAKGFAKNVAR